MNIFIRGYFYTTAASQTFGRWSSDMLREIREVKFEVTWSYIKRQTAKMTSKFVFFSSNPSVNHLKEKCLQLIATNTNIFTLLFNELKTDGKSFIFAVCRLPFDIRPLNVKLNLSIYSMSSFPPYCGFVSVVE